MIKRLKPHLLPILVLIILTFVFFNQILFFNKIFSTPGDIFYFNFPLKYVLSKSLKNFQLPLWSDGISTGHPIFAESQMGTFYLPNLILFGLLPADIAFNWSYPAIFLTSGVGVYFFLKTLRLTRISSIFAAIAFSFSSFFVVRIQHFHFIQAASLVPWEFFLIEKFVQTKKKRFLLFLSVILSQQIFTGFPQAVLYSILGFSTYFIFRTWLEPLIQKIKFGLFLATALIVGFTLAAVQLIPLKELLDLSFRSGGLTLAELLQHSGSIRNLAKFIYPYIFGNPASGTYPTTPIYGFFWENTAYVGAITIALSIMGLIFLFTKKIKNPILVFFLIFAASTALLALAHPTPLTQIFQVPPFSFFRIPARLLFLTGFSLAIVSAITLEKITKLNTKLFKFLGVLLILILTVDLFFTGWQFNTISTRKLLANQPPTITFLKREEGQFRIASLWPSLKTRTEAKTWKEAEKEHVNNFAVMQPNLNLFYDLESFDEYGSIITRRRNILFQTIAEGIKIESQEIASISSKSLKLLGTESVKFILTSFTLKNNGFELEKVFETSTENPKKTYKIYQNPFFLPRARIVYEVVEVSTPLELIEKVTDENLDLAKIAIVEKTVKFPSAVNFAAETRILKQSQNTLEIEAKLENYGILVVADSFYPGWKVFVDGAEKEILAVNANQRGVYLEKGEHKVIFTFEPLSLKIGGTISLISHLLLIFLILVSTKFKTFRVKWGF